MAGNIAQNPFPKAPKQDVKPTELKHQNPFGMPQ
jgi:hypothetical protein